MRIIKQTKTQQGFIKMDNTGFGYLHYTLSVWETEEYMKSFVKSGAHLQAMKESKAIATEIVTYTYQTDKLPNWNDAKQLLKENGKVLKF